MPCCVVLCHCVLCVVLLCCVVWCCCVALRGGLFSSLSCVEAYWFVWCIVVLRCHAAVLSLVLWCGEPVLVAGVGVVARVRLRVRVRVVLRCVALFVVCVVLRCVLLCCIVLC